MPYRAFRVKPWQTVEDRLLDAFAAYWVRLVADVACRATAQFVYE